MQRLIVRDFAVHARYLRELAEVRDFYLSDAATGFHTTR